MATLGNPTLFTEPLTLVRDPAKQYVEIDMAERSPQVSYYCDTFTGRVGRDAPEPPSSIWFYDGSPIPKLVLHVTNCRTFRTIGRCQDSEYFLGFLSFNYVHPRDRRAFKNDLTRIVSYVTDKMPTGMPCFAIRSCLTDGDHVIIKMFSDVRGFLLDMSAQALGLTVSILNHVLNPRHDANVPMALSRYGYDSPLDPNDILNVHLDSEAVAHSLRECIRLRHIGRLQTLA